MKKVFRLLLSLLVISTTLPTSAFAADPEELYATGLQSYGIYLQSNTLNSNVFKFALFNTSNNPLDITKLQARLTGTIQNADVSVGKFLAIDANGATSVIGQAPFLGANRIMTIQGASLFTIPAGETKDIIISVDLLPSAANKTLGIRINQSFIEYGGQISTPQVTGPFPLLSTVYQVKTAAMLNPLATILTPNGGEVWQNGVKAKISWKTQNWNVNYSVKSVDLWSQGVPLLNILTPQTKYTLTSTYFTPNNITSGTEYRIKVTFQNYLTGEIVAEDFSNADFTIQ